jgi:pimeloyl-ACP methyl ester carboxylesterase
MLPEPRQAEIDGRILSWREAGSGPALVLVHGIGTDSRLWEPQFAAFAEAHRVIAWDAPGYGASQPFASESPAKDDYVRALRGLLSHLNVGRCHIVGHSLGAVMVAGLCAAGFRPLTVTLMHPVAGAARLDLAKREQVRRGRIDEMRRLGPVEFAKTRGAAILGRALSPAARERAIDNMSKVSADGYLQAWEMMCAADLFADLGAIDAPVLVLGGGDDPVAPEASCRDIAGRLEGSTLKIFEGVGHSLPAEAPGALNESLAAFWSKTREG